MIVIDRVSSDDLLSLATDRGTKPMQVGAVLLLDASSEVDPASIVAALERRLPAIPRLRRRLVRPCAVFGRPLWVDDADFRVDQHIRVEQNPVPGDLAGLLALASTLVTTRLPMNRPLWAALVVPNVIERHIGLVIVLHHVLADGEAGLTILNALVDGEPVVSAPGFPGPTPTRRQLLHDSTRNLLGSASRLPHAAKRYWRGLRQIGPSLRQRAPKSSLNQATGPGQVLSVVRCDLDSVRDIAHAHHATINDVVLAVVAGAMHKTLLRRGEFVDEFVISVPFSSRAENPDGSLGNKSGAIPIRLPAIGLPHDRLRLVSAATTAAKETARGTSAAVLGPLFRLLAKVGVYQRFVDNQRLVNTFVTNVKGPITPVSLDGLPIRDIIPLLVTSGNVTASFAVLTYAGTLTITIVSDQSAFADVAVLQHELAAQLALFSVEAAP